jgi:hypothetical protein
MDSNPPALLNADKQTIIAKRRQSLRRNGEYAIKDFYAQAERNKDQLIWSVVCD